MTNYNLCTPKWVNSYSNCDSSRPGRTTQWQRVLCTNTYRKLCRCQCKIEHQKRSFELKLNFWTVITMNRKIRETGRSAGGASHSSWRCKKGHYEHNHSPWFLSRVVRIRSRTWWGRQTRRYTAHQYGAKANQRRARSRVHRSAMTPESPPEQ